jgi:hypothetical protein
MNRNEETSDHYFSEKVDRVADLGVKAVRHKLPRLGCNRKRSSQLKASDKEQD